MKSLVDKPKRNVLFWLLIPILLVYVSIIHLTYWILGKKFPEVK